MKYLIIAILMVTTQIEVTPADGENPAVYRTERTSVIQTDEVFRLWQMTGIYQRVIDLPVVYVKNELEYEIYCLPIRRFDMPQGQIVSWFAQQRVSLENSGQDVRYGVTKDQVKWLRQRGYEKPEVLE